MGTHRKRFLHDLPTLVAFLRGETRVHSDHLMSSTFSLGFKDSEECTPGGVHDGFRQMMVLDHVEDSQILNGDMMIGLGVLFGSGVRGLRPWWGFRGCPQASLPFATTGGARARRPE